MQQAETKNVKTHTKFDCPNLAPDTTQLATETGCMPHHSKPATTKAVCLTARLWGNCRLGTKQHFAAEGHMQQYIHLISACSSSPKYHPATPPPSHRVHKDNSYRMLFTA